MKKVLLIAFCAMAAPAVFAQESRVAENEEKPRFMTFGFSLGINQSNLSLRANDRPTGDITNGLGYRAGFISNFRFGDHFSLAPKAELSFNATRIEDDGISYKMNPICLELVGHFKYKVFKGDFSPYAIVGPNARIPISSGVGTLTNKDVALDLGVGLDIPILRYKISPEIRYSFGIKGLMEETAYSNIKFQNIVVALIFSGR
jgi:Outer membrane protein beta-barrel domain